MTTRTARAWYFTTPSWYDNYQENDGVWWDPAEKSWKPTGSLEVTRKEKNQATHASAFAQWASHRLAEMAPSRGWEACRRAVMRLVAAWGEYGVYTELDDRVLDAWFRGTSITDAELAEEARAFGYMEIATILEPLADEDDVVGGLVSMHKRVHY